jgi:hypothetical protein
MRWLIIFVLSFVLTFGGGITGMAKDDVPTGIMDGLMSELKAEVEYVKGYARNLTQNFDVSFAVVSVTAGTGEAVFEADLAPGESIDFKLKPGYYAILVIYTKDGAVDGVIEKRFEILPIPKPFGFNFLYGTPPVEA